MIKGLRSGLVLVACLGAAPASVAQSWLDTDFYCRVYGCVIVHDGFTFDVYDNYKFAGGGTVQPGEAMIPWTGNPFQGVGQVNPVITGERTEAFTLAPLVDESSVIGVDLDGDGALEFQPTTNASGFIDASSVLSSFSVGPSTRVGAVETSSQRSFYLSSRTDFFLNARVVQTGTDGIATDPEAFERILFEYDLTLSGNDEGMAFGADAHQGNSYLRPEPVTTLADLLGRATVLFEVTRDVRQRRSDSLPQQSIRFDYVYGFDAYDLSMGAGSLRYQIEFDFVNR
ncbi:MAG: hypothetical protein AAGI03_00055 [Pseudomonadota bacterium]